MPALNANVTAYIDRVLALIDHTTQAADIDVECALAEEAAIGDTVIYLNDSAQVSRLVPGGCTLFDVLAGTSETLTITVVDAERGRVRFAAGAGPVAAYFRGDRLFQTFTNTGRRPGQSQPDTVPLKDMANVLQLLTDACDQGVLTATGGSTTSVVNANTLVDVDTGLTALIGATVTMVAFAAGTPGETSTVVACPDVNTLTVSPAFTGAVANLDTYTVTMDQIDGQISDLLGMVPHGTVTPDAPARNPDSFWYTTAQAIVHFHDQLASGMAVAGTGIVFTAAEIDSLRGLLRTWPTLFVSRAAAGGDTELFVSDVSMMAREGGSAVLSPGGAGGGTQETVAYTRPRRLNTQGWGAAAEGAGPIQVGDRTRGGEGTVTVAATVINAQPQGVPIELRAATHHAASVAVTPGAPAYLQADTLKPILGTLLDALRDTVVAYVLPT